MNKSELQLFHYVNSWLTHNAQGHYISAQAAYGSFLGSKDPNAWRYVSAKRADFVVFDRNGKVHLIIEFDGGGHYGNSRKDAAGVKDRDDQKNAAAASAGIPLLRITDLKNKHAISDALARIIKPEIGRHASKSTNSKEAAS
jgi:very-short-patch-repair endonuclease